MSVGCFGNDPEDRMRARELDRYLDKTYGDVDDEAAFERKMEEAEYYAEMRRDERCD